MCSPSKSKPKDSSPFGDRMRCVTAGCLGCGVRTPVGLRIAMPLTIVAIFLSIAAMPIPADASVTRMEVVDRRPVAKGAGFGPYERITGRLHYAIDPDDPANGRIADLTHAPRASDGRVEFAGDFILLKPRRMHRGNGRLIYGVNNRGNLMMLHTFNDAPWNNAPLTQADLGNGFLLRRGYTLLWTAWNWDVLPGYDRLLIDLPVATDRGCTITGQVAAEIVTDLPTSVRPVAWGGSRGYPPAALGDPGNSLTVRSTPDAARRIIPRDTWQFVVPRTDAANVPVSITLKDGFEPGPLYELVYTARDPRVVGLGLLAIRDAISFFRYRTADDTGTPNPLMETAPAGTPHTVRTALIYGFSQSARVIQHMLMEGLHVDEAGREVFDAAFVHGPGAGKGSFNHRFAQTTRHPSHFEDHLYPADFFPFTTTGQRDPETGQTGSLFDAAQRLESVPRVFQVSASTEYWTRAASLLHTDVAGRTDLEPHERVRLYAFAGAQHGVSLRPRRGTFEHCRNPLDYRPLMRALLVALDAWTSEGRAPPPSAHPRIVDGTLGTIEQYRSAFPRLPGTLLPTSNLRPPRLDHGARFATDGVANLVPPRRGRTFTTLVPLPDGDGLDRAGIRLPEVAVPLGTYLGWNIRRDWTLGTRLGRWEGAFLPFPPTEERRRFRADPRPSIEARYPTERGYLARIDDVTRALVERRFVLAREVVDMRRQARAAYGALTRADVPANCAYLAAWRAP